MGIIKCKKCPECGHFHDERDVNCICGKELSEVPLLDLTDVIDKDREVIAYAQTCPKCGHYNFIFSIEKKVFECYFCRRRQIQKIDPISYREAIRDDLTECSSDNSIDIPDALFLKALREKIENQIGSKSLTTETNKESSAETNVNAKPKPLSVANSITLTAMGEKLSFIIEAKDNKPYMLGREANQSDFLRKDRRVSREHCFLFFKDGFWYVKDNNSANGTFVNSKYIGKNGEQILKNGDKLKLGHNDDSITFIITI
jgi:hypothetical protein